MLEKIKSFFGAVYSDLKSLTWQGKVSLVVGLIFSIMLTTYQMHSILAKNGCAIPSSNHYMMLSILGLMGLVFIISFCLFGGIVTRMIFFVPAGLSFLARSIWRVISNPSQIKLNYTKIGPRIFLVFLMFIIAVLISIGAGYIWWLLLC